MAFDTIHSSASGKLVRPSCLRTARLIYAEGWPRPLPSAPPPASTVPIPRDLFHTFPFLKFYRGFTVSLAGIVPYAGTAFLTWGYLRAALVPVAPDGRRPRATPLADLGIGALSGADGLLPIRSCAPTNAGWWADSAWALVALGRDGTRDLDARWSERVLCRT